MNRNKYHDFILSTMQLSRIQRLRNVRRGRYYYTQFKKAKDGQVELTFNLPPTILRQMQEAISTGKKIRVFVPQGS